MRWVSAGRVYMTAGFRGVLTASEACGTPAPCLSAAMRLVLEMLQCLLADLPPLSCTTNTAESTAAVALVCTRLQAESVRQALVHGRLKPSPATASPGFPATAATSGAAHAICRHTGANIHVTAAEALVSDMAGLTAGCMLQHKFVHARPKPIRARYSLGAVMSMRSGGHSSQSEQLPNREGANYVPNQEAHQPSASQLGDTESVSTRGGSPSPPDAEVACCAAHHLT
jgi:hypothetical protein